jgi:hypothetical protein
LRSWVLARSKLRFPIWTLNSVFVINHRFRPHFNERIGIGALTA